MPDLNTITKYSGLFLLMLLPLLLKCQPTNKVYRTRHGQVRLLGVQGDSIVFAKSNKLLALINYEQAHIQFKLDLETIQSKTDTFAAFFHRINPALMTFEGDLGPQLLDPNEKSVQTFDIEGVLMLNGIEKTKEIKVRLVPEEYSLEVQFKMYVSFDLNLADFELYQKKKLSNEYIHFEMEQVILADQN